MAEELGGKYELRKKIKTAGMAEIYLGWSKLHGEQVVVKKILPHISEDERFRNMFLDEAFIAGRLKHEHIIAVRDFGEADDSSRSLYLVMDYVDGIDLRTLLSAIAGPMDPVVAARITADVALALEYAHGAVDAETGDPLNVVHRDVSPSNILIDRVGHSFLIDFGIARAASAARRERTQVGELKGKLHYMSPQQAKGAQDLDGRADIYSLGVVLYECLVGRRLFDADTEEELFKLVLAGRADLASLSDEGVPDALARVLERALDADVKERYPHAGQMAEDLQAYIEEVAPGQARVVVAEAVEDPQTASLSPMVIEADAATVVREVTPTFQQKTDTFVPAPPPEGEKTQLDIVYDWFKYHKGRVYAVAAGIAGVVLALFVVDVLVGVTGLGRRLNMRLFPPDYVITTDPPDASISLDGVEIPPNPEGQVVVERLAPGPHRLQISKAGWITFSTTLTPPRAKRSSGEHKNRVNYSLKRWVLVETVPDSALVEGLVGRMASPCTVQVASGEHTVEGRLEGFIPIVGSRALMLNVADGRPDGHHRIWRWEKREEAKPGRGDTLYCKGTFHRRIAIGLLPPDGELLLDGIAIQAEADSLEVPAGHHVLTYEKEDWEPEDVELVVDARDQTTSVEIVLQRHVTFAAKASYGPDRGQRLRDVRVSIKRHGSREPVASTVGGGTGLLPYGEYEVDFSREGYEPATRQLHTGRSGSCTAQLEPRPPEVTIRVTDETTGRPIADATVHYQSSTDDFWRGYWQTDDKGECSETIHLGGASWVSFRARREGYQEDTDRAYLEPARTRDIELKLRPLKDSDNETTRRG